MICNQSTIENKQIFLIDPTILITFCRFLNNPSEFESLRATLMILYTLRLFTVNLLDPCIITTFAIPIMNVQRHAKPTMPIV